jgi:hypothetical protein
MQVPSVTSLALLLGLSFFFGLAFEDFYAQGGTRRPGGVRTFPLLARSPAARSTCSIPPIRYRSPRGSSPSVLGSMLITAARWRRGRRRVPPISS